MTLVKWGMQEMEVLGVSSRPTVFTQLAVTVASSAWAFPFSTAEISPSPNRLVHQGRRHILLAGI